MNLSIADHKTRSAAALALLCAACGGGGTSVGFAPPQPQPDVTGPSATIHFPGSRSVTDRSAVTVTGTAFDPAGVASVTVNGIPATTDDRFFTWSATVPLVPGENVISITSVDEGGNTTLAPLSGTVRYVGPYLARTRDIRMQNSAAEVILVDAELNALVGVSLINGHRRVISATATGSGPEFMNPVSIAVFASGAEALVLDRGVQSILRVDLLTGDRTVFSGNSQLPIGSYIFSRSLSLDEANGRAYVTFDQSGGAHGVYAVDLATGDATAFSTSGVGAGPDWGEPTGMDLDVASGRLFVVDEERRALFAVQLSTGNREIVSNQFLGEGPVLSEPRSPRYEPTGNVVYLVDANLAALLSVDLSSGDRTVISDESTGSGPDFSDIVGLELDMSLNRVLVSQEDAVMAVDLANGERSELSDTSQGIGPTLITPNNAYGHLREGKLVVQEVDPSALPVGFRLTKVDLETGNRDVTASSDSGSGVVVLEQFAFECDRLLRKAIALGRVLIAGQPELAVYTIDLQTGDRDLNFVFENAPILLQAGDVEFDGSNSMAFVGFENEIWKVDLVNGSADLLSGPGVGYGPELIEVRRLVLDLTMDRLLVTDLGRGAVFIVQITDGGRAEITGPTVGAGPLGGGIRAIDIDRTNRRVAFSDDVTNSVYLANIFTGGRRLLFDGEATDSLFPGDTPSDLVVDESKNVVYVLFEGDLDAVLMIEMDTLEHVIVSR